MRTWLSETTVIPIFGPCLRVYGLGHVKIVAGGCGIRQTGERRSVVGKGTEACGNRPEYRRCSSSDLWSIPQCGFRNPAVGSH